MRWREKKSRAVLLHTLGLSEQSPGPRLTHPARPRPARSQLRLLDAAEELSERSESRPGFLGGSPGEPEVAGPARERGGRGETDDRGGMAAQIPIVAATPTSGIARNSKKRPASPSHNGSSSGAYSASKKKKASAASFPQGIGMEAMSENKVVPSDFGTGPMEKAAKPLPFKDPNFVHSGHGGAVAGKKNRTWKNLKQILASERALPWQLNDPNCELRVYNVQTKLFLIRNLLYFIMLA